MPFASEVMHRGRLGPDPAVGSHWDSSPTGQTPRLGLLDRAPWEGPGSEAALRAGAPGLRWAGDSTAELSVENAVGSLGRPCR